jgi:activating signal cointegrator complex subunit 3
MCSHLGNDRGPVLEVIVSRTNFISSHTEKKVRVVGLSTALANARDLADWLAIGQVSNIVYMFSLYCRM